MADDPLSAALERIRHRADGDDARVLVAAVEAVLKLAGEAKPGLTAACTCYDCEAWGNSDAGYDDYTPHPGRVLSWQLDPQALREAIARALTGEVS